MNSNITREDSTLHTSKVKCRLRRTILSPLFCSIAASFGVFGGIAALFIGLVCVILHAIVPHDTAFDTVGTVLLISAIPMILVGSVFLDEIERRK